MVKEKLNMLQRFRMKHTRAFWIDKNKKYYKSKQISDDYLKKIAFFISEGKGWSLFLCNRRDRINNIFEEIYKRKILPAEAVLNLHARAEYMFGFSESYPNIRYTWEGKFERLE